MRGVCHRPESKTEVMLMAVLKIITIIISNALRIRKKTAKSDFQLDYKIGYKWVLGGSWRQAGYIKR